MTFIRRIIKSINGGLLWSRALGNASHQDFAGSLAELEKIGTLMGKNIGDDGVPYYIDVLAGHVLCRLGRHEDALKILLLAVRKISSEKSLSQYDKDYIKYYCKADINNSAWHGQIDARNVPQIDIEFDSLRPDKVRPHLKRYFPIFELTTEYITT